MKESNSFKDILQRVLIPEGKRPKPVPKPKKKRRSAYVSEAMGSGGASPTTVAPSSYSGGTQAMPPFSKYSADSRTGSIDMRDIGKEEDAKAKNNSRKPYPLETVLDFIAHSGEDLQNAQSMIESSLRKNNVSLTEEQKKVLKDVHQTIKSSLGNICKAAKSINSISL